MARGDQRRGGARAGTGCIRPDRYRSARRGGCGGGRRGVAGLSAANAAASRGARVVVLEAATRLGLGATGQNAGILSAGINMGLADVAPGSLEAAMWPATTEALLALVEQAQAPGALLVAWRTGSLSLAESATAARHLAREARARVAAGLRAEIRSPQQVAEVTGGRLRTDGLRSALLLPDEDVSIRYRCWRTWPGRREARARRWLAALAPLPARSRRARGGPYSRLRVSRAKSCAHGRSCARWVRLSSRPRASPRWRSRSICRETFPSSRRRAALHVLRLPPGAGAAGGQRRALQWAGRHRTLTRSTTSG